MSGNKHDNGVLEVGTDEITQSYSEDTPGQHVEQFIKEREKSFHAEQKRTQKHFSQVFQNPLDGYPYNEEITVRPIKEDFGIFEVKDLNDVEFDIKQYSKMYKSAKFKETKKGIEVKVKGKKHMITKHPMQNAWVVDGRNTHMIPSINTAIGIIMSKYEEVTEAIAFGFDTMKGANDFKRKFPDSKPVSIVKLDGAKKHIVELSDTSQASKGYVEKAAKYAVQVSLSEGKTLEEKTILNTGEQKKIRMAIQKATGSKEVDNEGDKFNAGSSMDIDIKKDYDGDFEIEFNYGTDGVEHLETGIKGFNNLTKVIAQLSKKFKKKLVESTELNEETVIDIARRVVDKGGAEKVKGVMLDTFTASAIVQVYDKVNDSNKQKMEKMPLPKLAAAVWKILGK